jgi:hypothetical protein
MHILIALALAAVLLYFWLTGNWFARVLVFLLLSVAFGFTSVWLGLLAGDQSPWFVLALLGVAVAWPVASVPIYCWRRRNSYFVWSDASEPPSYWPPLAKKGWYRHPNTRKIMRRYC